MIMTNHPLGNKIEDFEIQEKIGSGGFASVHKAKCKRTDYKDVYVAIKMIDIKKKGLNKRILSEIDIQSNLYHPAIVKLHTWFSDDKYVYLVLDLCERGSLDQYLRSKGRLSEKDACYMIRQIIMAMKYLQEELVLHRDLSLKNILLTADMKVKIADFGMATRLQHPNDVKNTMLGTANYMSPEVIQKEGYSTKADCWSAGCILYALLYGTLPFDGKDKTFREIMKSAVTSPLKFPSYASLEARELLEGMLKKDPDCRIDIFDALNYPFFRKFESTVDRKLELNPLRTAESEFNSRSLQKNLNSDCFAPNCYGINYREMNGCDYAVSSSLERMHVNKQLHCHPGSYLSHSEHQIEQENSRQRTTVSGKLNINCMNQLKSKIQALPPRPECNEYVLSRPMYPVNQDHYPAHMQLSIANQPQQFYSNNGLESQLDDVHIRLHSESPLPYPSHHLQNIRIEEPLCSQSCYSVCDTVGGIVHSGNGYIHNEMSYKNPQDDIRSSCSHDRYCTPNIMCSHEIVCCCHRYQEPSPTIYRSDHHEPHRSHEEKNYPCLDIVLEKHPGTKKKGLKGVVEPLTTERLDSTRFTVKNNIYSILDDGQVCWEFLKAEGSKKFVYSVCFISGDGQMIHLYKPKINITPSNKPPDLLGKHCDVKYYSYDDLPKAHWKKYIYAKKFIDTVKATTPKVTVYGEKAKCLMMENSPNPNYKIHFYDGCLITETKTQITFIDQNGDRKKFSCNKDLGYDLQSKWDIYITMKKICKDVEASVEESTVLYFPITIGRKPSGLLSTPNSNKENTSSLLRSSALNGTANESYPHRSGDSGLSSLSNSHPAHKNSSDGCPNLYGSNIKETRDRSGDRRLPETNVSKHPYSDSISYSCLSGDRKSKVERESKKLRKTKKNRPINGIV